MSDRQQALGRTTRLGSNPVRPAIRVRVPGLGSPAVIRGVDPRTAGDGDHHHSRADARHLSSGLMEPSIRASASPELADRVSTKAHQVVDLDANAGRFEGQPTRNRPKAPAGQVPSIEREPMSGYPLAKCRRKRRFGRYLRAATQAASGAERESPRSLVRSERHVLASPAESVRSRRAFAP